MKIQGIKKENVEVEITRYEARNFVEKYLLDLIGLKYDSGVWYTIGEVYLYENSEVSAGSHSFTQTHTLRVATDIDIKVLGILKEMKSRKIFP